MFDSRQIFISLLFLFRKCDWFEQILTNVRLKLHGESVENGNIDRALVAEKGLWIRGHSYSQMGFLRRLSDERIL